MSYEQRSATLNFTPKEEIKAIINKGGSEIVFLDVRGESEIAAASLTGQFSIVYMPCSRDDATKLVERSGELIPDKNSAIIVFCASGARARTAQQALEANGYTTVHNAGGLSDLDYIQSQ
eukprot:188137_1